MVKLAQHIWPSADQSGDGATRVDAIVQALKHNRSCDVALHSMVSTKSPRQDVGRKFEENGAVESIAPRNGKGDDLQTGRQRRTLADFFQSPMVVEHRVAVLHQEESPKENSELLIEHGEAPRTKSHTSAAPSRGKKGLFAAHGRSGDLSISKSASKRVSINIPEDMVGLAWLDSKPLILSPGDYSYPSQSFSIEQFLSDTSSLIKHGNLHRVRIEAGHLGVAWLDGRAVLLEPGVSVHSCSNFSYITTNDQNLKQKEFVLGPFRVVTVHDSEVGIKFCNRRPQVLYTGRHCLSISKLEVFAGFESMLRRYSNVSEVTATSSNNMRIEADISLEWQIGPEDAATARVVNITDVEVAVCAKVRRAFTLVMWGMNGEDIKQQLDNTENCKTESVNLLPRVSSDILTECMDLFEEGWSITLWDIQLKRLSVLPATPEDTSQLDSTY